MSEEFEEFGYNPARYERPTRNWMCGHSCDGKACKIGPSGKGKCRASFECVPKPYSKGDLPTGGFTCTRPKSMGGACEKGPLPDGSCCRAIPTCQPIRSVRAKRGLVVFWTCGLSLGFLLLMLCSPLRSWFVAPGELTAHHQGAAMRQLTSQVDQAENCSSCHTAALEGGQSWIQSVFVKNDVWADGKRCIECHDMGPDPFKAHHMFAGTGSSMDTRMACSNCHKEHRGTQANLKRVNDQQCQTCHSQTFKSFAKGHPEFASYPYQARTRIQFDHGKHMNVLFSQPHVAEHAPTTCADCHTTDDSGKYMWVKPFALTCAKCHDDEIKRASIVGLGLPAINLPVLKDKQHHLGSWPANADEDDFMPLSDTFQAVLKQDGSLTKTLGADAGRAIKTFAESDPLDLEDAPDAEIANAHAIAWAVKSNLHQLAEGNLAAWEKVELAGLPLDLVRSAVQDWLPNLDDELTKHAAGQDATITPADPKEPTLESLGAKGQRAGGWFRDDDLFTLNYQATGHADPYLKQIFAANPDHPEAKACLKCHSVDEDVVNWQASRPQPYKKDWNRFNHGLHFMLMDQKGCLNCHQVNATADVASGYTDRDPDTFVSSFNPMQKATCQQCHNGKNVRDDCLTCHNYHVGHFPPALSTPPALPVADDPSSNP